MHIIPYKDLGITLLVLIARLEYVSSVDGFLEKQWQ